MKIPKLLRDDSGQLLVAAIVALIIALILTPALVKLVQQEVRTSVKQKKSSTAFTAAEAGVDRATWKLNEHVDYFKSILDGGVLAGYNNDVIYEDVDGGKYRVKITSETSETNALKVVSTGKDTAGKEYRAVEVILKKSAIDSAIYAPSVTVSGSAEVHWGPVMSLNAIDLIGSANVYWPRKMARSAITASGALPDRDTSPTAPNTDNVEWWSYNSYPVPDPPAVDLAYYKTQAQSQSCPAPGGGYGTDCYYDTGGTINIDNLVDLDETKVRYFESNTAAKFAGSKHFRGFLICLGNLEFVGSGKEPEGVYLATVPANAYLEYAKDSPDITGNGPGATAPHGDGQFAGDDPSRLYEIKNKKCNGTCSHGHSAGGESPNFKGFVFVRGQLSCAGSATVHGAIFMDQGATQGTGSFKIFYDDSLSIKMLGSGFTRKYWREVAAAVF